MHFMSTYFIQNALQTLTPNTGFTRRQGRSGVKGL